MKRKKLKPSSPCKHEEVRTEMSYMRRTSYPIDGYRGVFLVTCRKCNKHIETIGESDG